MVSAGLFIKRLFDVLVSSTVLVFLSPLIALIATVVKCHDGGPVLFTQPRVGKDRKTFKCYKFRTMVLGAETIGNALIVTSDDSRMTRVGRWLRLWSLDELPQLLNVLRGDMSIVGPRPWVAEQAAYCSPKDARRFEFKPGLAGWAVIHGRNNLSWTDRIRLDLWYVDHWSLWLDFLIFIKAFVVIFRREGVFTVVPLDNTTPTDSAWIEPEIVLPGGSLLINVPDIKTETQPLISVIIPAQNAEKTLKPCLESVIRSGHPSYECIVVNDGSTDRTGSIAKEFGVRVIDHSNGSLGPAYARNQGAGVARGDILFFVDSDVVLAPGALDCVAKTFQEKTDLAAVFGSYDASPTAPGVISQYRNLLHHFVHQVGNSEASTFWAGCGAIRREVFEQMAGFDEKRFPIPSIEDIELGYRLRKSGYRILLDKSIQGTHLKEWNLSSLIRTDIFCRAIPWARLIFETNILPNDLNVKMEQRVSFALVALAIASLPFGILETELLAGSLAALIGVVILNRGLYGLFFRRHGILFTTACIPLHLLYYLYSGLSYCWVWLEIQGKRLVTAQVIPTWNPIQRGATGNGDKNN
jgi:lipopolysaccharide/colanic/teichoic acid biosynthesis glycosyltransferase/glycosyltransferase involved in cell wall biosynthesis